MNTKKKQWSSEEVQLLELIKTTNKQKNWKMISKALLKKGFKRTQQECRHKWVNCLSPQINHEPWTDQELRVLYTQYNKNLSRWSIIQKLLPNRTQIKIKNHFYGVLRNIVRFILKNFRKVVGRQTQVSNKINPNTLKSIYWGEGQFQFLNGQIKKIITIMKFRFNKQKLLKIVSQNQKMYTELNSKILQEAKSFLKIYQYHIEPQNIQQNLISDQKNDVDQFQNLNYFPTPVQLFQPSFPSNQFNIHYQLFPQYQQNNQIPQHQNIVNSSIYFSLYYYCPNQNNYFGRSETTFDYFYN